jgi:YegS/Rv2252/BmrU family lipid kinase
MSTRIILNPVAGRGAAERSAADIAAILDGLGLEHEIVRTERPWHAADLAESAAREGCSAVVTASGDGTANEALNGLMRARADGHDGTAMSILPVGTGNDFAYGLGMRGDLESCCRALADGHRVPMDVGVVHGGDYPDGRYFGNGVGIGFDAAVGFEAVKIRRLRGLPAYLLAALRTIFIYYEAPTVHIRYGDEELTQASLMVSVMNGQRMGGGFFMAPDGHPGDGELDLCIAASPTKLRILRLITYFLKGTQATQPEIRTARSAEVSVRAVEGTLPAHCDGETLCLAGDELRIEMIPAALEFIAPPIH